MATGPDFDAPRPPDPDLAPDEEAEGGGLGDPASTRFWLSSAAIAVLVLIIAVGAIVLFMTAPDASTDAEEPEIIWEPPS